MSNSKAGYGKPPVANQFKPGQSGNKKGRPKRLKSPSALADIETRALLSERDVRMHGKKKRMTVYEVIILRLIELAVGGDLRACKLLAATLKQNDRSARIPLSVKEMTDSELQLLKQRVIAGSEA